MIDWLRRVDPAFYHKEPHLLRTQAQIARYTDEAQAELRLNVLTLDRTLHAVATVVAILAYIAATAAGAHATRGQWLTVWAFAVLAVAVPGALPWSARSGGGAAWRPALLGVALIAIPALWSGPETAAILSALLAGATLYLARGRSRVVLIALAVGVLFGAGMPARPFILAPLAGILAAGAAFLCVGAIARAWPRNPQLVTWAGFAALLAVCAYTFAFNAPAVALRVPLEIAAIALADLGVCVMAGRIRRAELIARPSGVLSIPQSIVPLLDRSYDHAITSWLA